MGSTSITSRGLPVDTLQKGDRNHEDQTEMVAELEGMVLGSALKLGRNFAQSFFLDSAC